MSATPAHPPVGAQLVVFVSLYDIGATVGSSVNGGVVGM